MGVSTRRDRVMGTTQSRSRVLCIVDGPFILSEGPRALFSFGSRPLSPFDAFIWGL